MAKAAEAFRTISEVADDLGIQKHVLRFWEVKFSQIRPMKRGGGRRYYRPEDMELLRGIRQLLHRDGYTIKGVQKILREQGVDAVKERARSEEEKRLAAAAQSAETTLASVRSASESAAPQARGAAPPATPRARARQRPETPGSVAGTDRRAVIDAVIAELTLCRQMLTDGGSAASGTRKAKPERRARRSA